MEDQKRSKMRSRKFWVAVFTSTLVLILTAFFDLDPAVALAVITPAAAWMFVEGYVDGKRAGNTTRTDG